MWIVNGTECTSVEKAAQEVIDDMDDSYFVETLDEIYGTVSICGHEYDASYAYQCIDPTGLRCEMLDYYDGLRSDIESELDDMEDGDEKMLFEQAVQFISDGWAAMKESAEALGWKVSYNADDTGKWVTFENWSPLGEDIVFEASYETIDDVEEIMTAALWDFDPNEHVRELIHAGESGLSGVPNDIKALSDDAEEIGKMLEDLVMTIREAV